MLVVGGQWRDADSPTLGQRAGRGQNLIPESQPRDRDPWKASRGDGRDGLLDEAELVLHGRGGAPGIEGGPNRFIHMMSIVRSTKRRAARNGRER